MSFGSSVLERSQIQPEPGRADATNGTSKATPITNECDGVIQTSILRSKIQTYNGW